MKYAQKFEKKTYKVFVFLLYFDVCSFNLSVKYRVVVDVFVVYFAD